MRGVRWRASRHIMAVLKIYSAVPDSGFNHWSSQAKNSRCQHTEFCGFRIQWFSSGNDTKRAGIPRSLAALNAIMP